MGDQVDDTDARFAKEPELVLEFLVDGHVRGGRWGHGFGFASSSGRVNGLPSSSLLKSRTKPSNTTHGSRQFGRGARAGSDWREVLRRPPWAGRRCAGHHERRRNLHIYLPIKCLHDYNFII
jgi:hypothetical protein